MADRKTKPLITRLRGARILLSEWRRALADSERVPGQPRPTEFPPAIAHELARFDSARAALTEAIRDMTRTRK